MSKYMMATVATHKTGDISRNIPDLCVIGESDDENYIGNWVTGFGFVDVKFPKATTRELTVEEVEKYHGSVVAVGNCCIVLNLKNDNLSKSIRMTRTNDGMVYEGTLKTPVKVGNVLYVVLDAGKYIKTSTILGIDGNKVNTRNSTYIIEYL